MYMNSDICLLLHPTKHHDNHTTDAYFFLMDYIV